MMTAERNTEVKGTDVRIPETKFTDWSIFKVAFKEMQAGYWRPSFGSEDDAAVERMLIQVVEGSPTKERRLYIYTDRAEDTAPARTVDLGEFGRVQEAVMKVVRLGAAEAGRTKKQPVRVDIHYSVRETRHIEEVSPQVAASVAALALADEQPEFLEMNGSGGKECEFESVEAR